MLHYGELCSKALDFGSFGAGLLFVFHFEIGNGQPVGSLWVVRILMG